MNGLVRMAFRMTFVLAVAGISYLAFTPVPYPGGIEIISDKVLHAAAFFTLALLLDFSFPNTPFNREKVAALLAYGVGIEIVQYFLPWREASLFDILADGIGMLIYGMAAPLLARFPVVRSVRPPSEASDGPQAW